MRTTQTIETKKRKQRRIIKTEYHRGYREKGWRRFCWGLTDDLAEHDRRVRAPLQEHLGFAYINLAHTWNNFPEKVKKILRDVKRIVYGYLGEDHDSCCCCCHCR